MRNYIRAALVVVVGLFYDVGYVFFLILFARCVFSFLFIEFFASWCNWKFLRLIKEVCAMTRKIFTIFFFSGGCPYIVTRTSIPTTTTATTTTAQKMSTTRRGTHLRAKVWSQTFSRSSWQSSRALQSPWLTWETKEWRKWLEGTRTNWRGRKGPW